jgi:hypothetical protein
MAKRATAKKSRNDFNMKASSEDVNDRASFDLSGILRGIIGRLDGKGYANGHRVDGQFGKAFPRGIKRTTVLFNSCTG